MAQRLDEYEHSNLALIISQKKRIETIINRMNDPVIGLDENKKILFVNEQAQKLLSMDEKELIDQYAPDVAIHNDLIRTLLKEESTINPLKIFTDERESYFTKEVIIIHSQEKEVGKVILLRNVTSFKELDLAKTNFIATVSHELKTPLSSIQLCTTLLEDNRIGELNIEQKEILTTVKSETNRLMKITGELLDITQIESGNIQLHPQQVSAREIVNYAYEALKFPAEQKHIIIEIDCPDGLSPILVDLEKTAWVLVNFLSNAIRYSPENGKVTIRVERKDNAVTFKVSDSGKGIDPQYKDKIFDKFYKVPDSDFNKTGTGLGLAISKEFITAQGGKIWVESEPGKGSVFGFEFVV